MPFNVFAIVAFKKALHWSEALRANHDIYYDVVSPLVVWGCSGWFELAYEWVLSVTIVVTLRWYDEMSMDTTVVVTQCALTWFAFHSTMLIRAIVSNLTVQWQRRPSPDFAMYICCFLELIMEGFNGLFVAPVEMTRRIAWVCYVNPMYYVMLGLLRVEGFDDAGPQDGAVWEKMWSDVWLPCVGMLVCLNGALLCTLGAHSAGHLASI